MREVGVYSETLPWDADPALFEAFGARGVVLSGGPESVHEDRAPTVHASIFGLGVVGFDLEDIAWTREGFAAEKAFVLRMIDAARARHRWDALGYDPPFAEGQLGELRALVEGFTAEHVLEHDDWSWRFDETQAAGKCARHAVYLHGAGCLLCND